MKVSIICPIHDKSPDTVRAVLDAIQAQQPDQTVIVLDRAPQPLRDLAMACEGADVLELDGPKGWRSPCISFNAGLEVATGDVIVINHSDVVQAPGNLQRVRAHFETHPDSVLFARVTESNPELLTGPGHAGPVLCSSDNTRPLTFLTAAPTTALKAIGGWDLAFQKGVCYEDDDLTARLWKHGLDFHFDDAFAGEHQTHTRAYFLPRAMAVNQAIMLERHQSTNIYRREAALAQLTIDRHPGHTTWRHPS